MTVPTKFAIGAGVLIALALLARFLVFQRFGVDIHVHDTYWVISIRKIAFWIFIALAAVSLVIAVYKLVRHNS
jgi:heme/copper-type cytochrome/quinol oxidase subunit 1